MKTRHQHLTLEDREKIAIWKAAGKSLRQIAQMLGKHHSTLSRELKRNKSRLFHCRGYWPARAHVKAATRKIDSGKRKGLKNKQIRDYVTEKLKLHWTPELIAGRLAVDHPDQSISHEAIYQFVYYKAWHLFRYLPRKHKRRRLKFYYSKHILPIPWRTFIDKRPDIINLRTQFGHWEADSMVSKQSKAAIHVLCERKSRYLQITKIHRNTSRSVCQAISRKLSPLPLPSRLSITYDNGLENCLHHKINKRLKTLSFFCQPYHSWEKGSVENSIGLIRRFLPKKTDLQSIPRSQIHKIQFLLNNRPRKCLNYLTPNEAFHSSSSNPSNGAFPS